MITDPNRAQPTPGPAPYTCTSCGWSGEVRGRPRCQPCSAASTRRWRAANPEKAKALKAAWRRRKGPEYDARRKRLRRTRNPDTQAAAWRRRVEWLRMGDVARADLIEVYERDGGCCVYCGKAVAARFNPLDPRGFDHPVARSRGGRHTKSNLVVSCGPCNATRSDGEVRSA